MRKRVQIAVAVLLVGLVGVIAWPALRPQEREPVYQRKGLRRWLRESFGRGDTKTEDAVRHIGTNAIPALLNDTFASKPLRRLEGSTLKPPSNQGSFPS